MTLIKCDGVNTCSKNVPQMYRSVGLYSCGITVMVFGFTDMVTEGYDDYRLIDRCFHREKPFAITYIIVSVID